MDFFTFVSSVIESLAWPMLVGCVLYYGRTDIFRLIKTIKSIKYDKFEMMFEEKAAQAASEAESISGKATDNSEQYKDFVFLSPYETVMKSFMRLEEALQEVLKRKINDGTIVISDNSKFPRPNSINRMHIMRILSTSDLVDSELVELYDNLRSLRNLAAHSSNFVITQEAAKNFADSSIILINKLNEI
ncbi:hypothetical protein [Proteus terrae]|uniref:hypothetical protein n=1 Tax=Proteus terrae TaxID=1574161 RepID=UPI00298D524B|nr:hypothetical protein [Proteus terrae]WPC97658.1 hypothetical protein R5P25_12390 [Proteus terrae]